MDVLRARAILPAILCAGLTLAGCGGGGSPAALQSISITPGSVSEPVGSGQQLHATGSYSDGTTQDLTASATWSSSATGVATVAGGLVTGVAAGSATVSAAAAGVTGSSSVSVVDAWTAAASSPVLLSGQTATLLNDGTLLVDGGDPQAPSAAVYDPAMDTWALTGPPATARFGATATLLNDGRVLVAGGKVRDTSVPPEASQYIVLASAELYDPATGTWSAAPDMPSPRQLHAAVLLQNGEVLVVGGDDGQQGLPDALLFDPVAGTWASAPIMLTPYDLPTATMLASGKVLVTVNVASGASSPAYSEIYDPASGSWSYGPAMHAHHLLGATATLLGDGRVLVGGGQSDLQPGAPMSPPEVFDPDANTWTLTGAMAAGRIGHTATLLDSGKVLLAGGRSGAPGQYLASSELYDPQKDTWTAGPTMTTPRAAHGAVAVPGGVFVTGGQNQGGALQSSETYR